MAGRHPKEIVLDDRRRTSLARIGRPQDDRYLIEEFRDGTVLLTPAVTVSALELAALQDANVRVPSEAARHGDRGQLRRRGSFTRYAESLNAVAPGEHTDAYGAVAKNQGSK